MVLDSIINKIFISTIYDTSEQQNPQGHKAANCQNKNLNSMLTPNPGLTSELTTRSYLEGKGVRRGTERKEEIKKVLTGNFCQLLKETLYMPVSFTLHIQPLKLILLAPFPIWETLLKITHENGI